MLPSIITLLVIVGVAALAVRAIWKKRNTGSCCGGACDRCGGACGKPVKK